MMETTRREPRLTSSLDESLGSFCPAPQPWNAAGWNWALFARIYQLQDSINVSNA